MKLHSPPQDRPDVLRAVAFHEQARPLLRPGIDSARQSSRGMVGSLAARAGTSGSQADAAAVPAGYADGFALGHEEGRRAGEAEGSASSRAHADDALRRALEAQQRDTSGRQRLATAQHDGVMQRLERLHADFQVAAGARLHDLEADATALAFEAVCRLIGHDAGHRQQLASGIAEAMRRAREGSILRVRVRPDALPLLAAGAPGRALMLDCPSVQWVADPRVEGEGCILDTDIGSVDARMEVQLDQLRRLWSAAIRRGVDPTPPVSST